MSTSLAIMSMAMVKPMIKHKYRLVLEPFIRCKRLRTPLIVLESNNSSHLALTQFPLIY